MEAFQMPDWAGVFVPDASLFESFARGTLVYLGLLVLFRVVLKRQSGSIGMPDIMLVVLVSECVSNSLSAQASSVSNGLALVAALLFWNYALDKLGCHWPWLQRVLEPPPVQVVKDGQPLKENMKAEGLSDDELAAQLRTNGIDDVTKVKAAFIESGGGVSVIPKDEGDAPAADAVPPPSPGENTALPDEAEALRQFLAAAEKMQAVLVWHERRAADHRAAAKEVRDLLARHGVRPARGRRADEPPG